MTGWLLDTNILSELRRPRPGTKVVAFVESKPLDLLFVSVVPSRKYVSALNALPMLAAALS